MRVLTPIASMPRRRRVILLAALAALSAAAVAFATPTAVTAAPAPTTTAASAPPPPTRDGLLVVDDFRTGQIYTTRPDGSALRQLTHVPAGDRARDPDVSTDGRLITYDSDQTGSLAIYTMAIDGTGQRRVFTDLDGYLDLLPAFYPQGRQLIFTRCKPDSGCGLATIRVDGTHLHMLTPISADGADLLATVSHDGHHVAFNRNGAGGIQAQIYVMRADGTHLRAVTGPALEATSPRWSPNDHTLLFVSNCCRVSGDAYTVDAAGGPAHRVTHTPYPLAVIAAAWAPSARRIVFASNRDHPDRCCQDLFIARPDGSHARRVALPIDHMIRVVWAPATH